MKKILKWISTLIGMCFGLGIIVSAIEKKQGKVGWIKEHKPYGFYERNVKRPLDFGLSLIAIVILCPVMVIIAISIKLKLESPILFRQKRPGLGGKIFTIRKYRTMTNEKDKNGELLPDISRLSTLGRILRSASLDELPELFNIICGDMSIVGPRPLVPQYLPYFTEEERHRHDIRPGLTGLAQASGRNALSWDARLRLDIQYVNKITFIGDLKIIGMTIKKVLKEEDIVVQGTEDSVLDFDVDRQMKINAGNGNR